MAELISDYIEE